MKEKILLKDKFCLSIKECSEYTGIGEKKIRNIINDHPQADFFLMIGNHIKIKRIKFEKMIDEVNSI